MRPNHLCNKLKVSKDKFSHLMRGLFRAAMTTSGTCSEISQVIQCLTANTTYHVDHSQYSRAVSQLLANRRIGFVPLNTGYTKCNIGSKIPCENEELESSRKSSYIHSGRNLELSIMSLAEDWSVENVLLNERKGVRRCREIPLRFVVEARQGPDILDRFDPNSPNPKRHDQRCENNEGVVVELIVQRRRGFSLHFLCR